MSNREDPGEKTMSNIDQPCEPYSTDTGIADSYKEGRLHPRTIFSGNRELKRGIYMIWTIFVVLVVLWLLGIGTSYTMGGFIHLLLALAIIVVLIRFRQGRRGSAL
jgi:hypothetical protein